MFSFLKFLLLLIYGTVFIQIPSKLAVSRWLILVSYPLVRFCNAACFLSFISADYSRDMCFSYWQSICVQCEYVIHFAYILMK
jgi:hypothetical protein